MNWSHHNFPWLYKRRFAVLIIVNSYFDRLAQRWAEIHTTMRLDGDTLSGMMQQPYCLNLVTLWL